MKKDKKSRIYIAGGGGMLGEAFYQKFNDEFLIKISDIDLNEDWLTFLDFRDKKSYQKEVVEFNPDWLFHLGAFTDLEYCEQNIEETYLTNYESVTHAVEIANSLSIPLLYISTAGIFDGRKSTYDESDEPNPLGHYAKSKYLGEKYVTENADSYLICRAGWMMGGGPKKDKKFIQKIAHQIKNGAKELFIVNDKLGTPTYTHDFAGNVKLLIENNKSGLFNMVCGGLTSRLEVTETLLKIKGLQADIKITEVNSHYFSKEYFAERPDCERLINKNLNDLNLNIMRNWEVALTEYIADYYSTYFLGQ